MRKIDHIRKLVYIIVGILTILSLVFTLYKKIGHAASGGGVEIQTYDDFPLPIGEGFGTTVDIDSILPELYTHYGQFNITENDIYFLLLNEVTDSDNYSFFCFYRAPEEPSYSPRAFLQSGSDLSDYVVRIDGWVGTCYVVDGHITPTSGYGASHTYIDLYTLAFLDEDVNNSYVLKSGNLYKYPLFSKYEEGIFDYRNDNVFFEYDTIPVFDGHSKGGVLENFIDSEDLIEDSSDVEKVDKTDPSDSSSVVNWLRKLLHGESVINNSIQAGTLTLGDYLGQIKEKIDEVKGKIQEGIDYIKGIYDWFTEPFDKDSFEDELLDIPLLSDLVGLKSTIEGSGMFDWSDVSPASTLTFTFDFGGAVLPHTQTVIDFSWYTGTVKNLCVAILCTFLVIGLFATIVNSIPNIISGHSGDKGGGSDS